MQSAWNKDLQFTVIRAIELFKFEQAQLASTKIKAFLCSFSMPSQTNLILNNYKQYKTH
jgi:hypothetical protein